MDLNEILDRIARGRTDCIVELLQLPNWKEALEMNRVKVLQWLVYYNDLTGIKSVLDKGGDLSTINLDEELGNAAFFGHWKICDFLINKGADVNYRVPETGETPLHNALAKAGRPYYYYVVRLLVEKGADVNAKTIPGRETGAFMRDVRTKGETPLHRAAAYADEKTIGFLIENGADIKNKDAHENTPLSWASEHLRPGKILGHLAYDPHHISDKHGEINISDHGHGWGNSMDWNLTGEYLPEGS